MSAFEMVVSVGLGLIVVSLFNIDLELSRIRTQLRLANEKKR